MSERYRLNGIELFLDGTYKLDAEWGWICVRAPEVHRDEQGGMNFRNGMFKSPNASLLLNARIIPASSPTDH